MILKHLVAVTSVQSKQERTPFNQTKHLLC